LHPHGPAASFTFPRPLDNLEIEMNDVLAKLSPKTATGRTYSLTNSVMLLCSRLIGEK